MIKKNIIPILSILIYTVLIFAIKDSNLTIEYYINNFIILIFFVFVILLNDLVFKKLKNTNIFLKIFANCLIVFTYVLIYYNIFNHSLIIILKVFYALPILIIDIIHNIYKHSNSKNSNIKNNR